MTEKIIEIINRNFDEFKGSNEAILHASEEIADIIEEKDKEIERLKGNLVKGQTFNRSSLKPEFLKSIDNIEKNLKKNR
jgi:DNA polymerase III delta prime subunit